MAFWNRDSGKGVVKSTSDGFLGWLNWGGGGTAGPANANDALTISAVFAAIRVLSDDIGKMPINLYKKEMVNGKMKRTIAHDHPYQIMLSKKPNAWMTSTELLRAIVSQAALGKGCLCVLNKVAGQVREVIPVPAGNWTQEVLANGDIQYRVSYVNGQQDVYPSNLCLFIHSGITLDGYTAVSAIEKARTALGIAQGLEAQQVALASNLGRPSGVLVVKQELSLEQKVALKQTWQTTINKGGGGVAVLDYDAEFVPIATSFVDSQFMEAKEYVVYEVARFFRVSPEKLFAKGTKTYASAREATKAHISDTLMPWVVLIEQALNRDVLGNDPTLEWDLDEKELLRGNNGEQADYVMKLLGSGGTQSVISINEARFELGLPALDGEEYDKPSKGGYAQAAGLSDQPAQEQNPQE